MGYAERLERQKRRAVYRQAQYETWAAKAEERAQEYREKAQEIMDRIPLGQPILVGHHSERRHRRDLERMERAMMKAFEEHAKAEALRAKAEASRRYMEKMERPDVIKRRIERLEADLRKLERWRKYYQPEEWERKVADIRERLEYWRAKLEEKDGIQYGPHNVAKGDEVLTPWGWAEVVRVNQKTVTIRYPHTGTEGRMGYEEIRAVRKTA